MFKGTLFTLQSMCRFALTQVLAYYFLRAALTGFFTAFNRWRRFFYVKSGAPGSYWCYEKPDRFIIFYPLRNVHAGASSGGCERH
jgi:hypothetical protein